MSKDRPDVTVLAADPPKVRTIGFKVYERLGSTVWRIVSREVEDKTDWEPVIETIPKDEMKAGMSILVWLGNDESGKDHWNLETVEGESGNFHTVLGKGTLLRVLGFDEDRNHWVDIGMANIKALKNLTLNK